MASPADNLIDALRLSGIVIPTAAESLIRGAFAGTGGAAPTSALERQAEEAERLLDLLQQRNDAETDYRNFRTRNLEIAEAENDAKLAALKLIRQQLVQEGDLSAARGSSNDIVKDLANELGENLETIEDTLHYEERRIKYNKEINDTIQQAGIIESKVGTFIEKTAYLIEQGLLLRYAQTKVLEQVQMQLQRIHKISMDTLKSMDQALATFERAFQFPDSYRQGIVEAYTEMAMFGATIDDTGKSIVSLTKNVTDFTLMGDDQRAALMESTILAKQLGLSFDTFTKGLQTNIKMLGMTGPAAIESMSELAATSRYLGFEQEEFAAKFAQMSGELARFGKEGTAVFTDMMRLSKLTGMEIEKLINITNKFDTFEGAAKQAGQLNAALGGNFVNAMDLMMATNPAERFEMIRDSILDTGLSFDDMSYYQKLFYKDALGLSDVGELAMVLSGNTNILTNAQNQNAESLIEQKERAQEVKSVQEALDAVNLELSKAYLKLIDVFKAFGQAILFALPLIKVLTALTVGYGLAVAANTVIFNSHLIVQAAVTFGSKILAAANFLLGLSFLSVAASSTAAAVGMGIVTIALAAMAYAFMFASPSKLVMAFFALSLAMLLLGAVGGATSKHLLAIGVAMALLGAGVFLALKGFTDLIQVLDAPALLQAAGGLYALSGALTTLLVVGIPGAYALGLVSAAILGLGLAMSIAGNKIEAFANMTASLVQLSNVASELSIVAKEINNIADAIDKIPERKAFAVSTAMRNTAVAATGGGGAGTAAPAPAGGGVTTRQPIQLFLDKDKMSEVVLDIIGGEVLKVIQQSGR
jgi:hypothetical protein